MNIDYSLASEYVCRWIKYKVRCLNFKCETQHPFTPPNRVTSESHINGTRVLKATLPFVCSPQWPEVRSEFGSNRYDVCDNHNCGVHMTHSILVLTFTRKILIDNAAGSIPRRTCILHRIIGANRYTERARHAHDFLFTRLATGIYRWRLRPSPDAQVLN